MLRVFLSEARSRSLRPAIAPLAFSRFFGSSPLSSISATAAVLQGRRKPSRKGDPATTGSVADQESVSFTPTPASAPEPHQATSAPKRKRLLAGQTQVADNELPRPARGVASRHANGAGDADRAGPAVPARTRSKSKSATAVTEESGGSVAAPRPPKPVKVAKRAKAAGEAAAGSAAGASSDYGAPSSAAGAAAKKRAPKGKALSGKQNAHLKRRAREEAEAAAVADEILAARAKEAGEPAETDEAAADADADDADGAAAAGGAVRGPRSRPAGAAVAAPSLFGSDLHGRAMPAYLDEARWGSMAAAGVHSSLLGKLTARFGFNKATPVQAAAFEVITKSLERCPDGPSRYDVAIHSETGSGKTLAYLLPLLSWLLESTPSAAALHHARTRVIIVTPTRELAHQVYTVAETVCRAGVRRGAAAESWTASVRAAEGKKAKKPAKGGGGDSGAVGRSELSAPPTVGSVSSASLLRVAKFVGEVPQSVLREANEGGAAPHIIIGTPATLAKLIPARINAGQLSAIVMDEGDELVRNHSIAAVTSIVSWASKLKHRPSVIAVSATPSHGLSSFLAKHARAASLRNINMLQSAAAAAAAAVAAGKKPRGAVSLASAVRADAAAEASQAAALAAVEAETGVTAAAGALVPSAGATVTSDAAGAASDTAAPGSAAVSPAEDQSFYLSRAALRLALPPTLTHLLLPVAGAQDTFPTFTRWLAAAKPQAVLSFHNSVESLEAAELYLRQRNVRARVLGSAYDVAQRHASIEDVKSGRAQVLLATEMAARGLDIPRLSHVLNFDPPANAREYVHRAGRVGRLSSTTPNRRGVVVTMTVGDQQYKSAVRMLRDELGLNTAPPLSAASAAADESAAKAAAERAATGAASPADAPVAAGSEAEALAAAAAAAISSPAPKILRVAPMMRADCVRGELQLSFIE